jgi:hypothetical protein
VWPRSAPWAPRPKRPVTGNHPGSVRAPLKTLDSIGKLLHTFKKKQLTLRCELELIKIETFSVKNPDIELGYIPHRRLALPIDISVLDEIALAEILTAEQIIEEGMRARVEEAVEARQTAVSNALPSLQIFGVRERHLQDMIDERVKEAANACEKYSESTKS